MAAPLLLGAAQLIVTDLPELAVASGEPGAEGAAPGVATADAAEAGPEPLALVATTLKV